MKHLLAPLLEKRNVLILGFGKEGQSTFRYIRAHFPGLPVAVADMDEHLEERAGNLVKQAGVTLFTGSGYLKSLPFYGLVIKSPGVVIPAAYEIKPGTLVTSQTRLMLKAFQRKIIGITGTKGKSTTSSLTHHLLSTAGKPSVLVGNIGLPPFDYLDRIGHDTRIVYEMSSHQLEDAILAPHIAVLLNLYPEHLDRYSSPEAYYSAKMRILSFQSEGDTFIYNEDIPGIGERIRITGAKRRFLSFSAGFRMNEGCYLSDGRIYLRHDGKDELVAGAGEEEYHLKGQHNRMNMMAAVLAAREAGASDDAVKAGLKTFMGLEHRLEYVGINRGIHFYNDSIATIPEATMAAVRALPLTDTLILGGYDRGLDYSALVNFLCQSDVRNFFFLGKAGERIFNGMKAAKKEDKHLYPVGSLQEAFTLIFRVTGKGRVCLLSPAAASYDSFRNFEERGHIFKKIARGK